MLIVDTALKKRAAESNPVRVGMIGAGFMGRGIANQIANYTPGMELVAIANRTAHNALNTYAGAGVTDVVTANTTQDIEAALAKGKPVVTEDAIALCAADGVDVLIEATGHIEFGTLATVAAIDHGKHMVLMNAEMDATIGPLLKRRADQAGVVLTGCDGDQPGVQMNLYRFVESIGLKPLVCGNIKGLQDRYRNPTTQAEFAKQWGQTPSMVTSFADGTKISFEQAIVANATGMCVEQRGMRGTVYEGHVDDLVSQFDVAELERLGGVVDYVVRSAPSPGVYVYATNRGDTQQAHYLNYGKLGEGPIYSFYVPYHLTIFEVPLSAARVALFNDTIIAPLDGPVVDVIAVAKTDLEAGASIDGLGEYMTYGMCENSDIVRRDRLLPMGIAEGARLKRAVQQDQALTYDDVELAMDHMSVKLRLEQDAMFGAK